MGRDGGPVGFAGATMTVLKQVDNGVGLRRVVYLIETTSQSLATAALQILLPRKPLPPHTTSFFFAAAADAVAVVDIFAESAISNPGVSILSPYSFW